VRHVRPRAIVFAAIFLVAFDIALRLINPVWFPADFRIPDRTLVGYDRFVESMKRDPGVRIAVVGDSVTYGSFTLPEGTLSAHMSQVYGSQGRRVSAYNFGLSGAHLIDLLPVVAKIADKHAADVIVLQFDPRFASAHESVHRRYPTLYDDVPDWGPLRGSPLIHIGEKPSATPGFEERVSNLADQASALYGDREYLAAALLGDLPSPAIDRGINRLRSALSGKALYGKRARASLRFGNIRRTYDIPPYTADNTHIKLLVATLDMARSRGVPVVVVSGPVDSDLLNDEKLWDPVAYRANLDVVRSLAQGHGATFVDMTYAVPSALLHDTHHPLSAGYRTMAVKLAVAMDPIVRSAEASRGVGSAK
jgi:hypothetical protein